MKNNRKKIIIISISLVFLGISHVNAMDQQYYNPSVPPSIKSIYSCKWNNCNQQFIDLANFCRHVIRHIPRTNNLTCKWIPCNRKQPLANKPSLKNHLQTYHGKKIYQCNSPSCQKTFLALNKLRNHQCIHSKSRYYLRSNNVNSFSRILPRVLLPPENKPYKCPHCKKKFKFRTHCEMHKYQKHNDQRAKVYKCTYPRCKAIFKYSYEYKSHIIRHKQIQNSKKISPKPSQRTCHSSHIQSTENLLPKLLQLPQISEDDYSNYLDNDFMFLDLLPLINLS